MGSGTGAKAVSAERLQGARESHRRGELGEAIAGYSAFLAENPQRGDVWHLRAVAEHQSGNLEASWESVSRALATGAEASASLLLAGMVLQDRGDLEGAQQRYAEAAKARPGWAAPLANRGQVLMDLGRPAEAIDVLRAAAGHDPNNPRLWNNIGLALLTLDRFDEGSKAFYHSLGIKPTAPAHFNIARIHNTRNDLAQAFQHAQAAVQLDPRFTEAHLLLGDLHRKKRDAAGMRKSYGDAVRSNPNHARARSAYAEYLSNVGEVAEAREQYRAIWEQHPGELRAALGATLLLPQVYSSADDVRKWRAEYEEGLGRLEAARERFTFATPREAMLQARWTNFYLAYQGQDDRPFQARYGDFLDGVLSRAMPGFTRALRPAQRRAKPRIGFCSHFFFNCTAGRYFASWVTRLDRSRFEVFVYYTNEWMAEDTKAIAAAADTFRHLPGRSFDSVAAQIREDRLDVLVYPELGMYAEMFALGALRLAPVQAAGWGHPTTTGLPAIDYFLSSEPMEPPDAQRQYREKLVLLPGLGTHYRTPAASFEDEREAFGQQAGTNLYLVPQSLFKIHPDNDALLCSVMRADPRGKLVFFAAPYENINAAFAARLSGAMSQRGLQFDERTVFLPYMQHDQYLRVNASCDVMLDTLHWSGGNTSLDAIAAGLPVITWPGALMRGRQSAAMLGILGLDELVATGGDDYVAKAVALANDKAKRAAVSARMRSAHPALFGRDEPIRALEEFLSRAAAEGG